MDDDTWRTIIRGGAVVGLVAGVLSIGDLGYSAAKGAPLLTDALAEAVVIVGLLAYILFLLARRDGGGRVLQIETTGGMVAEVCPEDSQITAAAVRVEHITRAFSPDSQFVTSLTTAGGDVLNNMNQSMATASAKAPIDPFEGRSAASAETCLHTWQYLIAGRNGLKTATTILAKKSLGIGEFRLALQLARDATLDGIHAANGFAYHVKRSGKGRIEAHYVEAWDKFRTSAGRAAGDLKLFGEEMRKEYKFPETWFFPELDPIVNADPAK